MICKKCNKNESAKGKSICHQCKYLREKMHDPIGLAYRRLKSHAKQRGKEFLLTKEEFQQFCVKSEYAFKSGISKNNYHIDRIDETKGYSIDNIQVLTNSENVRKYAKWHSRDVDGKCHFITEIKTDTKNYESNAPF